MKHAGVVLAAGESKRMGRPKALLVTRECLPLAQYQAMLLRQAGCPQVVVVLGSDYEKIRVQLGGIETVHNTDWESGQFSSVQAGLRELQASGADGYFILPVDTVGVKLQTFLRMKQFASNSVAYAVRPVYKGQEGRIAWISKGLAKDIVRLDPRKETSRLDRILKETAVQMQTDDPAVVNNTNTPDEWEEARPGLALL